MFNKNLTVERLNAQTGNLVSHLGIEVITIEEGRVTASMPVDERTIQPLGLLHGGASVVLAETLGSIGAISCIDSELYAPVGLEINANHIKSARSGRVYGTATALHIGKKTQVWEIKIHNEQQELVCASRITLAIIPVKK